MEFHHLKYMGETLRYWCKKQGISIYKLSKETRINYHAVKNIEDGNKSVQLKTYLRYAHYIYCTDNAFNLMQTYNRWQNYNNGLNGEDKALIDDMQRVLEQEEPKD